MSWEDREIEELKLDEGFKSAPYKDSVYGTWTIGYGHTGPDVHGLTPPISESQGEELLREDFSDAVNAAQQACPCFDGLDGPRKGALGNMAFQLGGKTLSTFHEFLHLLDIADYETASEDLEHTAWYKQTPNRAQRIAYRIQTGEYADRGE